MRGTPADEERLRRLEDAIDRLRELADAGTVVVEGARDLSALDWLGIGGLHVAVHKGRPLTEVAEHLASCPQPIVLLLDWDRTGGRLAQRLLEELRPRVQVDDLVRKRIASCCKGRTLEDLPGELQALRRAVHGSRP